jgi:hypothetical protein
MKDKSRNASLTLVSRDGSPRWSFLTNHAQVLLCIAQDPEIRLREIGDAVGITERERNGRRNHYTIQSHLPLPDPLARKQKIGDLLAILAGQPSELNG